MTSITFSPDGQRILIGRLDGKLRSWMTVSDEQLLSLDIRPNGWPNGMFSRGGSAILATSGFEAKLDRNHSSSNRLELSVSELQSDARKNVTSPTATESGP